MRTSVSSFQLAHDAATGGATYAVSCNEWTGEYGLRLYTPDHGFQVAGYGDAPVHRVSVDDVDGMVRAATELVEAVLAGRAAGQPAGESQVGLWVDDDGIAWFELSRHVTDRETAMHDAAETGEYSVYDWASGTEVRVAA